MASWELSAAASLTILRLHLGGLRFSLRANGACMAHWLSERGWLAVAFVALACSGSDVHAFALCEDCPDLFASTPIAQQAALPQQRAQSTRLHDRYVSRRQHQGLNDSLPASLAFAAERAGFTLSELIHLGESEAATPATAALRIDELFNIMAAGPSDQPEQVAALRSNMLSQFRLRQSFAGPDNRTAFLVPAIIAFGGGLLIGTVLISAKSQTFGLPRIPGRQRSRSPLSEA
jgi:hypothetical protein